MPPKRKKKAEARSRGLLRDRGRVRASRRRRRRPCRRDPRGRRLGRSAPTATRSAATGRSSPRCPIDRVEPTPFQRDLSEAHVKRLTERHRRARPLPRSDHRRAQRRTAATGRPTATTASARCAASGARSIVALVLPEPEVAYKILALNTEKAHNLREKSLEVIRMARDLAPRDSRSEKDYALEFEEAAFLTLGVCYEQNGRFAGGAYHPC